MKCTIVVVVVVVVVVVAAAAAVVVVVLLSGNKPALHTHTQPALLLSKLYSQKYIS